MASEIFPKWKCFGDAVLKQNNKKPRNKSRKIFNIHDEADNINKSNVIFNTDVKDNNEDNEYHEIPTKIKNHMDLLNTCIPNQWRPYGVMLKLLHMWRFNQTTKIAAITLFKLAETQIDRALGFNSLLNLSKEQFVYLTRFAESMELENILIGKAVKCYLTG